MPFQMAEENSNRKKPNRTEPETELQFGLAFDWQAVGQVDF